MTKKIMNNILLSIMLCGAMLSLSGTALADVIYSDDFSSDMGWTLGTKWQIGATSVSPSATGNPDPALDNTTTADNGVLGTLLGGNIGEPDGLHGFYYATSPIYDLSGVTDVNFSFYRWLNSDYDPYMTSQVEVFDGAVWQMIYTNCCVGSTGYVDDNSWNLQNFDVSAYADGNSLFQARFSYDVTSGGVYSISGWNVDDLQITAAGAVPTPATLALFSLGLAGLGWSRRKKS